MTQTANKVDALSFEDALSQLESIVSELERGETPLEQTIARFERGIALSRRCEDRLNEADRKVAILLREGSRVVEVDMESGERLSVTDDPGIEVTASTPTPTPAPQPAPARRPSPPARSAEPARSGPPEPPPRGDTRREPSPPRPAAPAAPAVPEGQMSLGQAFAIKNPAEMDDDDIPF